MNFAFNGIMEFFMISGSMAQLLRDLGHWFGRNIHSPLFWLVAIAIAVIFLKMLFGRR